MSISGRSFHHQGHSQTTLVGWRLFFLMVWPKFFRLQFSSTPLPFCSLITTRGLSEAVKPRDGSWTTDHLHHSPFHPHQTFPRGKTIPENRTRLAWSQWAHGRWTPRKEVKKIHSVNKMSNPAAAEGQSRSYTFTWNHAYETFCNFKHWEEQLLEIWQLLEVFFSSFWKKFRCWTCSV